MASDAMSIRMMTGSPAPQAQVVATQDGMDMDMDMDMDMAMHADCAGHAVQNSHCPTCSHCQACSAVALAMCAATPLVTLTASEPPSTQAKGFSSAELSPGHKPPIS
jgi:hypothetical protein